MRINYQSPEVKLLYVALKKGLLTGSNGEDLRMSTYGNRGDDEDNVASFWN